MKAPTFAILAACCISAVSAQTPTNDLPDSLGLTQLKKYSSHRVSSGNSYIASNDDSKRIMPGDTLVMADVSGPGMVTHLWFTVASEGDRIVPMFYYRVDYRTYPSLPRDVAYFHAYYRQERPARAGHNYEFLNIKGTGHYVGTVLSVVQTQLSWFGEGDDLFYIDGAKKPQIYGTGSEDYFNDAWGLRDSDGPWTGTPIAEGERLGSRLSAYRWHVPDPISFTTSLWAGIEHAGWTASEDGSVRSAFEERPDYFSSVAFWYQKGVNEGLPEPPYGRARLPFGNATQIAVEDALAEVKTEGGKVTVQREVDWAKDLLFFEAQGQGAKMHVPIDIPEAGRYELVAQIAEAPDYGDYIALLDGQQTNLDTRQAATSEIPFPGPEVFHNYLPEVYVAKDRPLGMFDLSKGRHILTFVCKGRDPHSAGYNFGIQEVVLERVPPDEQPAQSASGAKSTATAAGTVVYRGQPLSYYIARLKNGGSPERSDMLRAIGSFGPDATTAVTLLGNALSDESPVVRGAAASSLAQVGSPAAVEVPALAKLLSDSTPRVRSVAAVALRNIGASSAPALPQLIAALNDPA